MLNSGGGGEQNGGFGFPPRGWALSVSWQDNVLDAVVGEYGVNFVGDDCDQGLQEGRCRMSVSLLVELRESKLRCAVNRDKQVRFAFFSAHFPDFALHLPASAPPTPLLPPPLAFDRTTPA